MTGTSNDINHGFTGEYVWLVPERTTNPTYAVSRFELVVQGIGNASLWDLAKGAGGKYRYLLPLNNAGQRDKIISARLLRSPIEIRTVPPKYSGMTGNINKDRGGQYLYLVWTTTSVIPSPMLYVSGFDVVYGKEPSEEPKDTVAEIKGGGNNINTSSKGRYVWIVPRFSTDVDFTCTAFQVVIQNSYDSKCWDLAYGAGGAYRYLLPFSDIGIAPKIVNIELLRSSSPVNMPPTGYSGMTANINQDLSDDCLYLIWQTTDVILPARYISGFKICYGDMLSHEPRNAVTEIHGKGDNVDMGFGGSHVWIIPDYTTEALVAATSFMVVIPSSSDSEHEDPGNGAVELYRHLKTNSTPDHPDKISSIRLLRSTTAVSQPPDRYAGITSNLNARRGDLNRSYLYVIWETVLAPEVTGERMGDYVMIGGRDISGHNLDYHPQLAGNLDGIVELASRKSTSSFSAFNISGRFKLWTSLKPFMWIKCPENALFIPVKYPGWVFVQDQRLGCHSLGEHDPHYIPRRK